ncbi:hypothetical protein SAMN05443575_0587 [Jatrophihabitans endophyticus]|uniref:Scramblase n=1 Tax=Jatrophihabitans endophyticus TaxID=1206085 RepID=A0A1M5DIV7_9ACTN|nr:hypothetical protein [Jatrophihabitans endophyticus]SHF66672.1 hypothetical protein SAMN05443575_0587 [Jatrophihabitans endophyticus]
MATALEVIAFVDEKQDGVYPVLGTDGSPVAFVTVPWLSRKFEVAAPDGRALCAGRPAGFGMEYEVTGAGGATLLTVRASFWRGKQRVITRADGTELRLTGDSWPSRDWTVTDAADRIVLGIEATAGTWSFHPDAYAVRVGDPTLTLAEVVGIVQANRMLVKAARAGAGGG